MSVITNIIDAIRRIGSPTERSALKRQDEQLKGSIVLDRGRRIIRDDGESVVGFHATVEASPEQVTEVIGDDLRAIVENAKMASPLFAAFNVESNTDPLEQLDRAFETWLTGEKRHGYSNEAIVEILGAFFGEHCNAELGMRWIEVSDQFGTTLAVNGIDAAFRAYPYQSVSKRIADFEHTFFRGIFIALRDQKGRSQVRTAAT